MPSEFDTDVLYALVREVTTVRTPAALAALAALSQTCRALRAASLPVLFADVRWPHPDKHDSDTGLLFFPEPLWMHFRRLRLVWPDHWPDASPPVWGDRYFDGGDYYPRHLHKLVRALPDMPALASIHISCPFFPPHALFAALTRCPAIRDLALHETPLDIFMVPQIPPAFSLERLALVPVAEALRVGEGPYDTKYREVQYYTREYRKRYKNDILARSAASAFLFRVGKAAALSYLQISGDLCTLDELAAHAWPRLHTLVLTGHPPRPHGAAELVDVVARMPALRDLRLLFAKGTRDPLFRVLPPAPSNNLGLKHAPPGTLSQLTALALSNACALEDVCVYTRSLERLAVCAIIDLPRVPIGISRAEITRVLEDMERGAAAEVGEGGGGEGESEGEARRGNKLKQLRVMLEDKVNPELCASISACCPHLEVLEVELCGYHDGKSVFAWHEFATPLSPLLLPHLHSLRICIPFPEFDDQDPSEPWRAARLQCARFLAERMGGLKRVGFEYRMRTGTHRYEDRWLEWEVERSGGARGDGGQGEGAGGERGGEELTEVQDLWELGPSWYPFPEVWEPVPIVE